MQEFLKDKRERKPRTESYTNPNAEPATTEARDINWEERTREHKPTGPRKEYKPRNTAEGKPHFGEGKPRNNDDKPRAGEENIIYGLRPVIEAIETEKQIEKLYVKKGAEGQLMADLRDLCYRSRIRYQEVPVEKLNRLTRGNHQGVVAVIAPIEYVGLEDILDRIPDDEKALIVVFDGVTDVRNFGAIARSAECAGAHGLITPLKNSAPVNSEAIRSSAGALSVIPVTRVGSIRMTLAQLQQAGFQLVAATEKSRKLLYDADFKKPTVLVMGAEDTGISPAVLKLCNEQLAIPMIGHIESLNVSAAAAVMLFEVVRQRIG